jgi:hypothetical protein
VQTCACQAPWSHAAHGQRKTALPRIPSVRCMSAFEPGLGLIDQARPQARTARARAHRLARLPQPAPTRRRRPPGGRPPPPRPRAPPAAASRPPTPARRSARRAGGPRARRRPPRPRLRGACQVGRGLRAPGPLCCSETRAVAAAGACQTASAHDAPSAMSSGSRLDATNSIGICAAPGSLQRRALARRPEQGGA